MDFRAHVARLRPELDEALARVLDSGWFVLGPEGEAFERELAVALGARHAVAVGNGTDALHLALRARGVGPGDEVITSSISAAFSALAILHAGARPVFVDVDPLTLNLDPAAVARALTPRTKALMPVHLYGHPADMDPLLELARERGLVLVEDACQAHGARYRGRPVGTLAGEQGLGALSFYPTKNLGALGDGGAILVNDEATAVLLRQLRNGGQRDRYRHESEGWNSRLDELQAALLRVGLCPPRGLDRAGAGRSRRSTTASSWARASSRSLSSPTRARSATSTSCATRGATALMEALEQRGIGTLIHYPIPLHLQPAFAFLGGKRGDLPVVEQASDEILSLPLYPELEDEAAARVVEAVRAAAREC